MNINWVTIKVIDLEKSKDFYGNYLKLNAEQEFSPDEATTIAFFTADNGMKIELIYNKKAKAVSSLGNISIGISVMDYDSLLNEAKDRKILLSGPVILGGHMECFFVTDPNGIEIQIIKPE